jgi:hypothetical protein
MTFDEYVDQEFQKNLELAREEMETVEYLKESYVVGANERQAWNLAREWTEDDIVAKVASHIERKWWIRQDGINKAFYQ